MGCDIYQTSCKKTFKLRNEAVATDSIFSDTPAIDSGVTMAQTFVGKDSLVSDVYPIHSSKQFVNTLDTPSGPKYSQHFFL